MGERGTKYKGSTPSNPLFGAHMDEPARGGPNGPGIKPQYSEAMDGLNAQAGGDMPEWPEARELGIDTFAPSTIDHVKRIDKGMHARLSHDRLEAVLSSEKLHRAARTKPIDKDD